MNTKLVSFIVTAFLAVFLTLSLVSAVGLVTPIASTIPTSVNHDAGSFTISFTLENQGVAGNVDLSTSGLSPTGVGVTFPQTTYTLADGTSTSVKQDVTATVTFPKNLAGSISGTILVDPQGATQKTIPFTVSINTAKTFTIENTKDFTHSEDGSLQVKNTGNQVLTITLSDSGDFPVSFSDDDLTLNPGASTSVTVIPDRNSDEFKALKFGDKITTVTGASTGLTAVSEDFKFRESLCKSGQQGNILEIRKVDIDPEGDTDNEWRPLEDVTVEVEVENIHASEKISDVYVELALFDSTGKDKINDVDWKGSDDEKRKIGGISDGKEKTEIFEFRLPADFEAENYRLAVKVYSEDKSFGSLNQRFDEDTMCVDHADDLKSDFFQDVTVEREEDEGKFIAFTDITFEPQDATCQDVVRMDFKVHNVGDTDQEQVRVTIRNSELDLDLSTEIKSDLNEGDNERLSFNFEIPEGLADKFYNVEIFAEYEYDDGNYEESSDETEKAPLKVFGCTLPLGGSVNTGITGNIVAISASLVSDAKAGEELVVSSSITNIGSSTADFVISASDYQSWANLDSISSRLITLNAGQSANVDFTFTVDEETSGTQFFYIEVLSNSQTQRQKVEVNISGSSGSKGLGGNNLIWVIGIINVVLILIIIIVAVRISAR